MKWYDYFLMFAGLIAPVLWTAIKTKNPDFPMPQETFVDTFIYIIEALLGMRLMKVYFVGIAKGRGMTYDKFIKG